MKTAFLLLLFALPVIATSDFSGVKAGTLHDFRLVFANTTTGYPITDGICRLLLMYPNNSVVFASMPMNHTSDGFYNYTYNVPATSEGEWAIKANCTSSQENATYFLPFPVRAILYGEIINQTMIGQQANATFLNNNLISLGLGVQTNQSKISTGIFSLGNGIQDNWTAMQYNVSQVLNGSVVSVNATFNITVNVSGANSTEIASDVWNWGSRTLTSLDISAVTNAIDRGFEDVKRLLREILARLDAIRNIWKWIGIAG